MIYDGDETPAKKGGILYPQHQDILDVDQLLRSAPVDIRLKISFWTCRPPKTGFWNRNTGEN